jgi:hypothetical protein
MFPDFQAASVARAGQSIVEARDQYEFSRKMLTSRLLETGALKRFPGYLQAA